VLIERLLLDGEGWPVEAQKAYLDSARMLLKTRASLPKR
jgi:hypothetical protein